MKVGLILFKSLWIHTQWLILLQADYSSDSHAKDHEAYMKISRSKRKRARAVADFERKDDDELGNIWRIIWMKTFDGYYNTIHEKYSHILLMI